MQAITLKSEAVLRLVGHLVTAQLPTGGWPAYQHRPADTESTAFASYALESMADAVDTGAAARAAAKRGLSWLTERQLADGGWAVTDQVTGSTWTTAPAVLALALLDREKERVQKGAAWLISRRGIGYPFAARLLRWVTRAEDPRRITEVDPTIPGWPWAEGTFSWVEPTSIATLALRSALARRSVVDVNAANARLHDAVRWFADRMSPGGGWNYGNRRILGQDISPYPDTTAWALLALHATAGPELTNASLDRLNALLRVNASPLARALAILALRAHGRNTDALSDLLASQCAAQSADTSPSETRTRALALLALSGRPTPLHVT